jgi:hypothetical protein
MDYGSVLSRAWHITWRNKALWILGILAGCSSSGGNGGGRATSGINYNFPGPGQGPTPEFFNNIPDQTWVILALGIVCLALILVLLFIVLGAIGKAGLMAAFNLADEGEPVGLRKAFDLSLTYFWRVLAIEILVALAWFVFIVVLIFVAAIPVLVTLGLALCCLIPFLILLGVAVSIYATLAQTAVVTEDKGVFQAFADAWEVTKANVGPLVVMGLVLIVGGFVAEVVIGLPMLAVAAPLLTGLLIGSQSSITSGVVIFGLCLIAYIPVAIVLNGVLQTYINGSWTLTYRRFTGREGIETLPEPASEA